MTPPALSLPRDIKQPDRLQPRDPKAAGGPSASPEAGQDAPGAEEAFQALVEKAADPASVPGSTSSKVAETDGTAKPEAEAAEPKDAKEAKETADTGKPAAPGAIPVLFAQPHPPMPPVPAQKGSSPAVNAAVESAGKDAPHKPEQVAHLPAHQVLKAGAETAEPKTSHGPAPAQSQEKFEALISEAKAPAEMPPLPQASPHAASIRPAEPLPPAPPSLPGAPPLPVVALPASIAIKALEGANRFDIRLDPEELGRIDVSLQIDKDGGIRASIAAEKPEALQLIVREARSLEQAFDQAGFRRDNDALSFSLSDQGQSSQGRQNGTPQPQQASTRFFVEGDSDLPPSLATIIASADGRLDVRI